MSRRPRLALLALVARLPHALKQPGHPVPRSRLVEHGCQPKRQVVPVDLRPAGHRHAGVVEEAMVVHCGQQVGDAAGRRHVAPLLGRVQGDEPAIRTSPPSGHVTASGHDGGMADVSELRVALTVDDFDAAVALYRDALGLEQLADWTSENGRVVLLAAGRATLELFDEAQAQYVDSIEAGRRVSGTVRLAFGVRDSRAAARRLEAAGAEPVAPPVETPWGDRNARVEAPDGMQLTLFDSPEGK